MMMRHVADLKPGDAVRPFGDDRLWRVVSVRAQGEEHDPRVMVTFGHPVDGETEVLACFSDLVTHLMRTDQSRSVGARPDALGQSLVR
jgi:hypothetical protein